MISTFDLSALQAHVNTFKQSHPVETVLLAPKRLQASIDNARPVCLQMYTEDLQRLLNFGLECLHDIHRDGFISHSQYIALLCIHCLTDQEAFAYLTGSGEQAPYITQDTLQAAYWYGRFEACLDTSPIGSLEYPYVDENVPNVD